MPRLAANLGMLFADRPLLARFGAAAAAGFRAVELQFPYAEPASDVRAEIERHGLTMLGHKHRRWVSRASSGSPPCPAGSRISRRHFGRRSTTSWRIGGSAIHCMAGVVPPEQQAAAEATFVANLKAAAPLAAEKNITLLIEPINPRDRPNYFLNRAGQAAEIIDQVGAREREDAVRFLPPADCRRRPDPAIREVSAMGRPCADRRRAIARGA